MFSNKRIGVVLAGGGAKGAYQVGVLKALAEQSIPIHSISGASIGALNAAVIASNDNLDIAYQQLYKLWCDLGANSPLKINKKVLLNDLYLAKSVNTITALIKILSGIDNYLLKEPIYKLIDQYYVANNLRIPLYLSLFKTSGNMKDGINILKAKYLGKDTPKSTFIDLQSLPINEHKKALMASASLPYLFGPQELKGTKYTDGGIGKWNTSEGNIPLEAFQQYNCHLDTLIIIHFKEQDINFQEQYPNTNIIQIRPSKKIFKSLDIINFSQKKIEQWIEAGYKDASLYLKEYKYDKELFIHKQKVFNKIKNVTQIKDINYITQTEFENIQTLFAEGKITKEDLLQLAQILPNFIELELQFTENLKSIINNAKENQKEALKYISDSLNPLISLIEKLQNENNTEVYRLKLIKYSLEIAKLKLKINKIIQDTNQSNNETWINIAKTAAFAAIGVIGAGLYFKNKDK